MEKHYATYELSKLAKDAGFDELCNGIYKGEVFMEAHGIYKNSKLEADYFFLDFRTRTNSLATVDL